MSMAANNHHSTQQYLVNGTMLLYTVEFVLLLSVYIAYTVGVVPTVFATSRSSTTEATSPSMPQSTDYVTASQSIPRASSTSTSSSYSSQLTNAS